MKGLEGKILNLWNYQFGEKKIKNKIIMNNFKRMNTWKLLTINLINKLYEKFYKDRTVGGKQRLVFNNPVKYVFNKSGEYFLVTPLFLHLFSRKHITIFQHSLPIFSSLKSFPVWWINNSIITNWNFFFREQKISTDLQEIYRFSIKKLFVFPRVEFAAFNFVESYSSNPYTIPLKNESEKILSLIELYIRKNFFLIPFNDIRDIGPLSFIIFRDNQLIPCTPYRAIIKPYDFIGTTYLSFGRIRGSRCLKVRVKYLTSTKKVRDCIVYYPEKIHNIEEIQLNKIYNTLIFSFLDVNRFWIYPTVFSLYEEDLSNYELFQEIFLFVFREKWKKTSGYMIINMKLREFMNEVITFINPLFKTFIKGRWEEAFLKLPRETLIKIIFNSISPVLSYEHDKIFFLPFPLGAYITMRNVKDRIELVNFLEKWMNGSGDRYTYLREVLKLSDSLGENIGSIQALVSSLKNPLIFLKYLKKLINSMEGENYG